MQRSVKFVRYLPANGWEPVVLTGPGAGNDRWTPADEALAAELPPGVKVYRVEGPEPPRSTAWRGRAERWLRLKTPFARWWVDGCVETGRPAGTGAEVVFVTMSPFESAEAASRLARALRLPWVADLRDPWALDEMMVYPTRAHRRRELRRMRRELASADAIVMNTPESKIRLLDAFPELRSKRVVTITNGFDPADFETAAPRVDTAFRIVHAGYLHTEMGGRPSLARRLLGGAVPGVDIGTRSHIHLLEAVNEIRRVRPDLGDRLEVHLAGVVSESDRRTLDDPSVRLRGYLSHPETVELMQSADLLFLPMQELPPGMRATIVPGKTYEYLATGRPILAAVPEGDVRDILTAAGNAAICAPSDVDGMSREILALMEGAKLPPRDPEAVRVYERPRLAAELARVLDAAARVGPAK